MDSVIFPCGNFGGKQIKITHSFLYEEEKYQSK